MDVNCRSLSEVMRVHLKALELAIQSGLVWEPHSDFLMGKQWDGWL
jgi:hypothetical protein